MKKLFIAVAIIATTSFAANAQLWIGGNLGFRTNNGSNETVVTAATAATTTTTTTTTLDPKGFNFGIEPTIGFMFNDKMGAGINLGYTSQSLTQEYDGNDDFEKWTRSGFHVSPFFRYVFLEEGVFSLFGDLKVNIGMYNEKEHSEETTGGTKVTVDADGYKTNTLGVGVYPGVQIKITDNLAFEGRLNILSLGFNSEKQTYEETEDFGGVTTTTEITNKNSNFGFGVNDPTDFTIGVVYKF